MFVLIIDDGYATNPEMKHKPCHRIFTVAFGILLLLLVAILSIESGILGTILFSPFVLLALFLIIGSFFKWPQEGPM